MRTDWIPHALVALAAFGGLYALLRIASRAWGERWAAFRRRPRWQQLVVAAVLLWLALRVARLGGRALLVYLGALAFLAAWGEVAAHDRARRAARTP
jgi:hypothetical protein